MIERLPAVARKICSSIDLKWEGAKELLLPVLKSVSDSVVHVKDDLPKATNEFLVFVAYFSQCILSANRDLCVGASELLYEQTGCFPEVSSPTTASVLLLYATELYFSTQQEESEKHTCPPADILNNQKYLQALDKAVGSLAQVSHDSMSPVTYIDSLEFVCKVLLHHASTVWKNFSEGEVIHYCGNMDHVLTTLHQFIDSCLVVYSCAKISEGDTERLLEYRGTLLRVLVSTIKISFVTNKDVKKSMDLTDRVISSKWLTPEELKFLMSSLGNIGVTLYNTGHVKEAPKAVEVCCRTIWAYIRLCYNRLLSGTDGNNTMEGLPKDMLKDIILDAFARIVKMTDTLQVFEKKKTDTLHRCGSEMTRDIVVKSLSE